MKKKDTPDNKNTQDSPGLRKAKTLSRRTVIKSLMFVPVQVKLFQDVMASRGTSAGLPPVNDMTGANNSGLRVKLYDDVFTPNKPMGKGQGIIPGRVSWVWNPSATNPSCANIPLEAGMSADKYDAWFMDKNTSQDLVDKMLADGLCSISGKKKTGEAWNSIFRYHNLKRGKGEVSYKKGEKIYLKLNRTAASGAINQDYIRQTDKPLALAFETSPQIVHAMLRQLVNVAGVPQESIFVGDTMRNLYQDEFVKYYAEFPKVNYLSSFGNNAGRVKSGESATDLIFYSDNKTVMPEAGSDKLYTVMEEADYLINLPSMKGHNLAGITLCAKNHFGTHVRPRAAHLHPGLNTEPARKGYGHYRVLVDIMGNKHTGDKNLFYILDALWSGSNWNGLPVKFQMPPFNNHWSSSLFLSLDPVAIESVAADFLRTEFSYPEHNVSYISEPGVDDYLHQAADPGNWPAGIIYAPNGDNVPMKGLGVHEHWNNPVDKMYSRNLGKTEGIELIKIVQS
ncbi:MAG: DUF362 domain-containing protein [Bacteroidales bacterium]|nr:DUF362 domain-containing protein [Bacteroidales bacterium]